MTRRLSLIACLALAACSESTPDLMTFTRTQPGPDEFLVVPAKPLETPPSFNTLPPPTPGGVNRADATPQADAVAALGGSPARLNEDNAGVDNGVIAYASRFGREPAIRQTLAEEDLEIRRRNNGLFLERVFNRNLYYDAYNAQQLDQQGERARLRSAGVPTAEAPPAAIQPQ